MSKVCPQCDSAIVRRPNEQKANHAKRIYCNAVCLSLSRGVRPAVFRDCKSCKKRLVRAEGEKDRTYNSRRYCHNCGNRCGVCKNPMTKTSAETLQKFSKRKFCSNACKGAALAKRGGFNRSESIRRSIALEDASPEPGFYESSEPVTIGKRQVARDVAETGPGRRARGRPKTRADCEGSARPCPWVTCRHNMYLDVSPGGGIQLNYPDIEPHDMTDSCSLDVAKLEGVTLDEVGKIMRITRERVRQIEAKALVKIRKRSGLRKGAAKANDLGDWATKVSGGDE